MQLHIGVISNPNSKKNWNHHERKQRLERVLGRFGVVRQTQSLTELPQVIDELLAADCKYWVCDGGDGTLHWVLNALHKKLAEQAQSRCESGPLQLPIIVPTNGGTVDFVARKAKLKGNAESIVSRLIGHIETNQSPSLIHMNTFHMAGQLAQTNDSAETFERIGLAAAIGGVAQNFFEKFYALPKDRGARSIVRVIGTAAGSALVYTLPPPLRRWMPPEAHSYAMDFFRPTRARVFVDGLSLAGDSFISLQIGAIDINLANVVRCFRYAQEDGVLHFQALSTNPMGVVKNVTNMLFGTPLQGKQVFDNQVRQVSIVAQEGERINPVIDGEQFYGLANLQLSLGPSLRVPVLPLSN